MAKVTKVLYDVDDAIKQLERLNEKVEESGDKANESLEDGAAGATLFGKAVERLSGGARAAGTALKTAVTSIASLPGIAVAAAAGVAAIVAQFIDFDEILKDSIKSIEAFDQATDTIQGTRDAFSSLGDAAVNRDLRLARRAAELDQAALEREQNAIERARNISVQRLEIVRTELSRREQLLQASADKEQRLRDRLAGRTARNAADAFGGPAGRRALDLGAAARQAAFEGNLEEAEALEEAARQAGEEAGNHNLFLRDQQKTYNAINRSIEKQIAAQEEETENYQNQVEEAQGVADALQVVLDREEQRLLILQQQTREIGTQQKLLGVAEQEAQETQAADQAARTFENNARDFSNTLVDGNQSLAEIVKGFGSEFKRFLTDERQRRAFIQETGRGARGAGEIQRVLGRVTRGQPVTAQDLEGLRESFNSLSDAVARLQVARGRDEISTVQERTLQRLENLLESGLGAVQAGADFRAARSGDIPIQEGTRGAALSELQGLRDGILRLNDTLAQPSRTASPLIEQQARSIGAPAPTQTAASNIQVNATVKGGIIDAETTKQITEIIRRELRKQTTTVE